ncbi:metallophosphoesterase [Mucilaginibacter paludis]|uniref:Metallophosphoesterase n=1 Tax=Mucilaginibacter paludis DSM 18603 TaxID=714943 RepID=H1Y2D1_9SPHI|nr:metallophosphoesterase [Mucilaginibacter paludis]EHQ27911.1 metallophosphoesterase [Mucilaginibacter paludis DSM 18603]
MVHQFLKKLLAKPIGRLAEKYDSRPDAGRVFTALTELKQNILTNPGKKGPVMSFGPQQQFIIFSDQHKGTKNGSDIFATAEQNYIAALEYYNQNNFTYINLGDGEELWENNIAKVKRKNSQSFAREKNFATRNAFVKIFGNHDLYWDNDPLAPIFLERIYGQKINIYEGAILQTDIDGKPLQIFLTHGHQGDLQSDGNWFSKWFIANVWGPLQMYLELNLNTPSVDDHLKTIHNNMMYQWSARQPGLLLITGHTHQPVFESLTHLERLYRQMELARASHDVDVVKEMEQEINKRIRKNSPAPDFLGYKPGYFNSGCCCFDDGDITGIEIAGGYIRLIKWAYHNQVPVRIVLEEITLKELIDSL